MPNLIAYAALLIWPLAIIVMFRKMAPERAFIWAILGGYLLLPEATDFNPPMIPALDKVTIPNLTAYVVCAVMLGMRITLVPRDGLARVLLVLIFAAPFLAALTNSEPITFGTTQTGRLTMIIEHTGGISGMTGYDAVAALVRQFLLLLPFILARNLLASPAAMTELLRALVIAGVIYSVPMLWELRFSPQLHTHLYGFFQHEFSQMLRQGGYRPIVFMHHGLWLAFFIMATAVASLHFAKQAVPQDRIRPVMAAAWLALMVVFSRSMGPLMLYLSLVPLILLASTMTQLRVAAAMGVVALTYPLLRGAELVPVERFVSWVAARSAERANSLAFRFENEAMLLERASEKPFFGWGTWGRNQVHEPMSGETLTISDGMWVIVIGQYGWVGYLGTFGLLCLPIFALWWQYRGQRRVTIPPQVGVMALILGANLIDLLPNATLVPLTWLIAGALLGHAEAVRAANRAAHAGALRDGSARAGLLAAARLDTTASPQSPRVERAEP